MQQTSFDGGSVNDNSSKSDFEKLYEAYESGRNVLRDEFQKRLSDAIIKDSGDKEKLAGIFSEIAKATWKLASKAASLADDVQKQLALYYCNDTAIACQYVLKLAPKTSNLQETVYRTLNEVQSKIIEFSGGKNAKLAIQSKQELEKLCHKKELEDLRATTKQAIEKLDKNANDYQQKTAANFSKIAGGIKQYLAALYKEAQEELLPMQAPCSYALIGLGSMAMEQMTPYSDIECAILTENNDYKSSSDFQVKHYFKNLSQLVHFKIISLGETIIPTSAFRLNLDDIVKPALNFDLGGKTPLGRVDKDKPYDLVQDVEQMLLYVQNIDNKSDHIDKNLAGILQKTTFIYGNQQLANDYSSKVSTFLLSKNAEGQVHCVAKAVKALSETAVEMDYVNSSKQNNEVYAPNGNLEQFSFDAFSSEGKLFDVKQEIYRMPDRLIYNLALIFGVQEGSSWQMVDTLKDKGFINEEASTNLKQALSFAANLRLKAYSHYGYQKEVAEYDKSYKKEDATEGLAKELSEYFSFTKDDLQEGGALFQFYYVMLAVHRQLTEFCSNKNIQSLETKFFASEKFCNDSAGTKGQIYYRLINYNKALECFEQELVLQEKLERKEHPAVAGIMNNVGHIYGILGQHELALKNKKGALEINKKDFDNNPHRVAIGYNNVGYTYGELDEHQQALQYHQQALGIWKKIFDDNHPLIVTSLSEVAAAHAALGQHNQALKYQKDALAILKKNFSGDTSSVAHNLSRIGLTYSALERYSEALQYQLKALEILQKNFSDNHPYIATALNNIGLTYNELGRYSEALQYQLKALEMLQKNFGDSSRHVPVGLYNIGYSYLFLNRYEEAINAFKAAEVYFSLGDNDKASGMVQYAKQAVDAQTKYNQADKALQYAKNVVVNSNAAAKKIKELLKLPLKVLEELQGDGAEAKTLEVLDLLLAAQEQLIGTCNNKNKKKALKKKALSGLRKEKYKLEQQKQEIEGKKEARKQKLAEVEAYLKEHGIDSKMIEELCFGSSVSNCNDDNNNDNSDTDDNSALLEREITNLHKIPSKEPGDVRIVSYNIVADYFDNRDQTADHHHHWKSREPVVLKLLSALLPDIICLQELSPKQAQSINKSLGAKGYKSAFLSKTPSELKTGEIVFGGAISSWVGKFAGTPLVCIFIKGWKFKETGRFWLKEDPDIVPDKTDRGDSDKGFGNMNTYRAVLWAQVNNDENKTNKTLYIFNSHYPLSGDNKTRLQCAQTERKKIEEITKGKAWVSAGDRNFIDTPNDNKDYNPQNAYLQLVKGAKDIRDSNNHFGISTSWLGFTYDNYKNPLKDGQFAMKSVLDVMISNYPAKLSFHHPGAYDKNSKELKDLDDKDLFSGMQDTERYFASDHTLIGADFILGDII